MAHDKQSPFTVSRKAVIDKRRQMIAQLRLRGMTQREIVEKLPALEIINRKTNRPYSLGIINKDLQVIHEQWRTEAVQDIAEHVARVLAELREVKRAAWSEKAFGDILRAIEKECKILGIDSPDKQIILNAELEEFLSMLPEEHQNAIRKLIIANLGGGGA